MRKSSAYKVPYDVRPSKQTERRILLDILRTASESGFDLRGFKYIGFGRFRFYDFEMLYRHMGVRDMTSIEADDSMHARCRFNKPFGFIDFVEGMLGEYLNKTVFRKPIIAWLDYDCRLSGDVVADLRTVCAKAPVGSFVFVTIDARLPQGLSSMEAGDQLAALKQEYLDLALIYDEKYFDDDNFPFFAERVVWAAIRESFLLRSEGTFVPLIRVFYKDSALMITVGGCLCAPEFARVFRGRLRASLRFLLPAEDAKPYVIPAFNLTSRERRLFDTAVTGTERRRNSISLQRLGFTASEVHDYRKLQRFIPNYFETYI